MIFQDLLQLILNKSMGFKMLKELDTVVITKDIPTLSLVKGDIGTIVHIYGETEGLEVEFVSGEGKTVGVKTLKKTDVRPMKNREILHVREMQRV